MISFSFVWELAKRDFVERFAGSILGSAWAFIGPLVDLFIYIIIFGKLMGSRLPGNEDIYGYSIYLAVGLIPWINFSQVVARSSTIFLEKKHIISKVKISLPSLLVFVSISEGFTFLITGSFLFLFLLATDYDFNSRLILLPFIYYLQQLLAFSLGLLSATLTVFIRDLKEVVGIILKLWFWFTPIVYVSSILPESVRKILVFNPVFVIIESYQRIFTFNDAPAFRSLIILSIITHFLLFLSYIVFRKLEKDIRDFL